MTTQENEELQRLQRENKQVRPEREILAKAAAWFARATDAVPQNLRGRESTGRVLDCRHVRVLEVSTSGTMRG